jgi:aminocarboxymuconate-semialdehyde decarboxylase
LAPASRPQIRHHLIAETGIGQIMIGTDYPFPWKHGADRPHHADPGPQREDRIAILGGTAKLLGIN